MNAPYRFNPEQPIPEPYRFVVVTPARFPAGRQWKLRRPAALPFRIAAALVELAARVTAAPLHWISDLIMGQPYGTWTPRDGWLKRFPAGWSYRGPVTDEIRALYQRQPTLFSHSGRDILDQLEAPVLHATDFGVERDDGGRQ